MLRQKICGHLFFYDKKKRITLLPAAHEHKIKTIMTKDEQSPSVKFTVVDPVKNQITKPINPNE